MRKRLLKLLVLTALLSMGMTKDTSDHSFVPGGGHFRGHGATSSW